MKRKIIALSIAAALSNAYALPTNVTFKQGSGDFYTDGSAYSEIKITSFNSKKTAFAVADNLNIGQNESLSIYKDSTLPAGGRFLLLDQSGLRGRVEGNIYNEGVKTFMIYPKGVDITSTAVINDKSGIIFVPGDVPGADTMDSEADVTVVFNRIENNVTNGGVKVQQGATVNLSSNPEFIGYGLDEQGGAIFCGRPQYSYSFLYNEWDKEAGIHLDTGDLSNTVQGAFNVAGSMHYNGNVSFKDMAFPTVNIDGIVTKPTTDITVDQYGNPFIDFDAFVNRGNEIENNKYAWLQPVTDVYVQNRADRNDQLNVDLTANDDQYGNGVIDEDTYYANMDAIYATYNVDMEALRVQYDADSETRMAMAPDTSDYRFDMKTYINTNQYDIQNISANGTVFMHNVSFGNDMKVDGSQVVLSKVDMGGNTVFSDSDVAVTQYLRNGTLNAKSIGIDTKNQNFATYTMQKVELNNVTVNANEIKKVLVGIDQYTDPTWYQMQVPNVTASNDILDFNIKNTTMNINGNIDGGTGILFHGDNNSTINAHDVNVINTYDTNLNVYNMYMSGVNHGALSVTGNIENSTGSDMLDITLHNNATLLNSSFVSLSDATVTGANVTMDGSFFGGFGRMSFNDLTMLRSSGINIDVSGHDFNEWLSPISTDFNLSVAGNLSMSYSRIGAKTGSYNDVNLLGAVDGQQTALVSDWGAITAQNLYVNQSVANKGHYGTNAMIGAPSSSAYLAVAGSTAIDMFSMVCWNSCAQQRYVSNDAPLPPVVIPPPVTPPVVPPVEPPVVPPVVPPVLPPVEPPVVVVPPTTPAKPDFRQMSAPPAYVVKPADVSETSVDRSTLYVPKPQKIDDDVEIIIE